MYVIGERINGMFRDVRKAIRKEDKGPIQDLARRQLEAGAQALDLNVGPASTEEVKVLNWLVETVREVTQATLAIDNPKFDVQKQVIPNVSGKAIINSTKADEADLEKYVALAVETGSSLVGLTIDQKGVPADVDKRVELGALVASKAMEGGLAMEDLFIDPIILPANVSPATPANVVASMQQLTLLSDPPPHLVLGLSNVSQGCNQRELINRTYLVMAMVAGMDAAIMDPTDTELMNAAIATELLQQKAIYCDSFLDAYRMSARAAQG